MIRVYCDTGGYHKALNTLVSAGHIELYQFKYEQKNQRIRKAASPSSPQYWNLEHYTYEDVEVAVPRYSDLERSSVKFPEIQRIIGNKHRIDAQHLDSAYMIGCKIFLTSDKGDIWKHRDALGNLLGMIIFHVPSEIETALCFITSDDLIKISETNKGDRQCE